MTRNSLPVVRCAPRKPFPIGLIFALLAVLLLASCDPVHNGFLLPNPSSRVLFIGNSFTFINDGVDQELKGLDSSIAVQRLALSGYTLQDHWNSGEALAAIRREKWDYVVLQDQSQTPVIAQAKFLEYVGKFNAEVKAAGGQTVLFMTWERPDSVRYGVTTQNLANAYYTAGTQFGIEVAPAGLAFARALQKRPDLRLYIEDGHPTAQGTYLAACVLYATIFGKSPVGNSYTASNVSPEEAGFLQRIAAESTGH